MGTGQGISDFGLGASLNPKSAFRNPLSDLLRRTDGVGVVLLGWRDLLRGDKGIDVRIHHRVVISREKVRECVVLVGLNHRGNLQEITAGRFEIWHELVSRQEAYERPIPAL